MPREIGLATTIGGEAQVDQQQPGLPEAGFQRVARKESSHQSDSTV